MDSGVGICLSSIEAYSSYISLAFESWEKQIPSSGFLNSGSFIYFAVGPNGMNPTKSTDETKAA